MSNVIFVKVNEVVELCEENPENVEYDSIIVYLDNKSKKVNKFKTKYNYLILSIGLLKDDKLVYKF